MMFEIVFGRYRYRVSGDTSGYRYRPILPLYSHAIPIPVNSSVSGQALSRPFSSPVNTTPHLGRVL